MPAGPRAWPSSSDEVTEVEIGAGGVTAVVLAEQGRRAAGAVVVAAGCRSGRLRGIPDRALPPVRPVKGLTLRLRAPDGVPTLRRTVRGLVHGRNCYLVPRPDRHGGGRAPPVEEKGFDLSVQAGAVGDLLDDARRLVPSLEEYELVETTTGLRPGSPDNGPIVGATGIPGLVMATGHYRNGILLAPVTAAEVVPRAPRRAGRRGDADRRRAFAAVRPRIASGPTDRSTRSRRRRTGGDGPGPVGDRRRGERHTVGRARRGPPWPTWWPGGARPRGASPWPATARSSPRAAGSDPAGPRRPDRDRHRGGRRVGGPRPAPAGRYRGMRWTLALRHG